MYRPSPRPPDRLTSYGCVVPLTRVSSVFKGCGWSWHGLLAEEMLSTHRQTDSCWCSLSPLNVLSLALPYCRRCLALCFSATEFCYFGTAEEMTQMFVHRLSGFCTGWIHLSWGVKSVQCPFIVIVKWAWEKSIFSFYAVGLFLLKRLRRLVDAVNCWQSVAS